MEVPAPKALAQAALHMAVQDPGIHIPEDLHTAVLEQETHHPAALHMAVQDPEVHIQETLSRQSGLNFLSHRLHPALHLLFLIL